MVSVKISTQSRASPTKAVSGNYYFLNSHADNAFASFTAFCKEVHFKRFWVLLERRIELEASDTNRSSVSNSDMCFSSCFALVPSLVSSSRKKLFVEFPSHVNLKQKYFLVHLGSRMCPAMFLVRELTPNESTMLKGSWQLLMQDISWNTMLTGIWIIMLRG